jgi:hypothetical protein
MNNLMRMRSAGHLKCMVEIQTINRILVRKPEGNRPL